MLTIIYLGIALLTDIADFNLMIAGILIVIDAIITVLMDV
mgnify:CR=1 FL=1